MHEVTPANIGNEPTGARCRLRCLEAAEHSLRHYMEAHVVLFSRASGVLRVQDMPRQALGTKGRKRHLHPASMYRRQMGFSARKQVPGAGASP